MKKFWILTLGLFLVAATLTAASWAPAANGSIDATVIEGLPQAPVLALLDSQFDPDICGYAHASWHTGCPQACIDIGCGAMAYTGNWDPQTCECECGWGFSAP